MAHDFNATHAYQGGGFIKPWEMANHSGAARVDVAITRYVSAAEALEGITAEDIRQYVEDKSTVIEPQLSGGRDTDSKLATIIRMYTNIADEAARDLGIYKQNLDILENAGLAKILKAVAEAQSKVVENLTAVVESRREVADGVARELEQRKQKRTRKADPLATLEEMNTRIQELEKLVADARATR